MSKWLPPKLSPLNFDLKSSLVMLHEHEQPLQGWLAMRSRGFDGVRVGRGGG